MAVCSLPTLASTVRLANQAIVSETIALPMILVATCEPEPNNRPSIAVGPILPNMTQLGCFDRVDDSSDFYFVDLWSYSALRVSLFDIPMNHDYDLAVYNGELDRLGESKSYGNSPEFLEFAALSPGRYFIQVFNSKGVATIKPYALRTQYSLPPTLTPSPTSSASPTAISSPTFTPTGTATPTPTATAFPWAGYNFESDIQGWTTSEGQYKLATLEVSRERAYVGQQSLKLVTELFEDENPVFRYTEATAYFDIAVPEGISYPGPYDLSGKSVSCFLYLPAALASGGNPQTYVRLFVKDDAYDNLFSTAVDITPANVEQWIQITLPVENVANFDATSTNALGVRFDLQEGSSFSYEGPIYIDYCSIEYP